MGLKSVQNLGTPCELGAHQNDQQDPWCNIKPKQHFKEGSWDIIGRLNYYDKVISRKFSLIDNPFTNILFGLGAWIFNRAACAIQIPVHFIVLYYYPQPIMDTIGTTYELNEKTRLTTASVFTVLTTIGFLIQIFLISQPLKKLLNRARPVNFHGTYRYLDMRSFEHHSSFPSGDCAAAAFCMSWYIWLYGTPWPFIIVVPLVMAGRVYVYCHWFGDTIAGVLLGISCSYVVMGPNVIKSFKPVFESLL